MLRADNVICGTSSTGTGTLTLAACPGPPGGLDFDKWLKATGFNFVSTNAVLVSYTIIEYTDATFATAKQTEKGIGTLTLGASITAATLARTTVQSIVTGLNATPAPTFSAPTAITIGTAANTLVFVGASAMDVPACSPYVFSFDGKGAGPACDGGNGNGNVQSTATFTSGNDLYWAFKWEVPGLIKQATLSTQSVTFTGSPTVSAYFRIYQIGTDGKPGKLLYDFGQVGTSTAFTTGFGLFSTGNSGSGIYLTPGEYFADLAVSWSGGTGGSFGLNCFAGYALSGRTGTNSRQPGMASFSATGATIGAAPDPANVAGWSGFNLASSAFAELPVVTFL